MSNHFWSYPMRIFSAALLCMLTSCFAQYSISSDTEFFPLRADLYIVKTNGRNVVCRGEAFEDEFIVTEYGKRDVDSVLWNGDTLFIQYVVQTKRIVDCFVLIDSMYVFSQRMKLKSSSTWFKMHLDWKDVDQFNPMKSDSVSPCLYNFLEQ